MAKRVHVPADHKPGMEVPKGGSCCANCKHYRTDPSTPYGRCAEPNFSLYYGTSSIPIAPDRYCSDWYDWDGPKDARGLRLRVVR